MIYAERKCFEFSDQTAIISVAFLPGKFLKGKEGGGFSVNAHSLPLPNPHTKTQNKTKEHILQLFCPNLQILARFFGDRRTWEVWNFKIILKPGKSKLVN